MELRKDAITVTIGIFSGRPNPELFLTGGVVGELAPLVKTTIGKERIHPPPSPRLGHYYGFLLHVPEELARRFELPVEFSVYSGVLTARAGREQTHWRDAAKVERFLFDQAYKQGFGDLLERVGAGKLE